MLKMACDMPCSEGGKVSRMIAWETGIRPPPPIPCRMRENTMWPKLCEAPAIIEPVIKTNIEAIRNRLRPTSVDHHPVMVIMISSATL